MSDACSNLGTVTSSDYTNFNGKTYPVYYRNNKPSGGFIGSVLLELQNMANPSTRHVIEMKQNIKVSKAIEADNINK